MATKPLGTYPPTPNFRGAVLDQGLKVAYEMSGEITASKGGVPIYAPDFPGRVNSVHLCLGNGGKDDSNTLAIECDIQIGGTSVLSTKPKITHVSGEAASAQSTFDSGTGITDSVIDQDNNDFSQGEVLMLSVDLTRTASPTTEMQNLVVLVDLQPK